jgi:hypothetical protein
MEKEFQMPIEAQRCLIILSQFPDSRHHDLDWLILSTKKANGRKYKGE